MIPSKLSAPTLGRFFLFLLARCAIEGCATRPKAPESVVTTAATTTTVTTTESTATDAFELDEATIADLQLRMTNGKDTARSLTQKYLRRIEKIDRNGPTLKSVIELNPDALSIADALDEGVPPLL